MTALLKRASFFLCAILPNQCGIELQNKKWQMKTTLALISAVLLLQSAHSQDTKVFGTNSFPTRLALLPKTSVMPKFSFASAPPRVDSSIVLPTTVRIEKKPFRIHEPLQLEKISPDLTNEKSSHLLAPADKEAMPSLYYIHLDRQFGNEEESDIFGRRWKLFPKFELLFPVFKWDSPSAVGERVTVGIGITWEFR